MTVVGTSMTPRQSRQVVVDSGSAVREVFTFSGYAECELRVTGVPAEFLRNSSLVVDYCSSEVGGHSSSVVAELETGHTALLVGTSGDLFTVYLNTIPVIALCGTGGQDALRLVSGVIELKPCEDLAFVRGVLNGELASPIAAQAGDSLVFGASGLLVVPMSKMRGGGCLVDLKGNYGFWEESSHVIGGVDYVDLQSPSGELRIQIVPARDAQVSLFGPDAPGSPAWYWHKQDPRHQVVEVTGGRGSVERLPPGIYTLRWFDADRRKAPVLKRVVLGPSESQEVVLDPAALQTVKYRLFGVDRIARHIGKDASKLFVSISDQRLRLDDKVSDAWLLDSWGDITDLEVVIEDPRVLTPLPIENVGRCKDGRIGLQVRQDVHLWRLRAQGSPESARFGPKGCGMGLRVKGGVLQVASAPGRTASLDMWGGSAGLSYHGHIAVSATSIGPDYGVDMSGSMLTFTATGSDTIATVHVASGPYSRQVGRAVATPDGHLHTIWVSKYMTAIIFLAEGREVGRIDNPSSIAGVHQVTFR